MNFSSATNTRLFIREREITLACAGYRSALRRYIDITLSDEEDDSAALLA